jgi:hypothetical protein
MRTEGRWAAHQLKGNTMERTMPASGPCPTSSAGLITDKIDSAAAAAHKATDSAADRATAQVDRLSGAAHGAVDSATAATKSLADSASDLSQQAAQLHTQLKESASASIRANPLMTLAGALAVGYVLGRLARL